MKIGSLKCGMGISLILCDTNNNSRIDDLSARATSSSREESIMDSKLLDLTGQKFSLLIAIKRAKIDGYPEFDGWECKCLGCGRICNVPTDELTDGKFHSCGCKHDGWKLAGKPRGRLLILRKDGHAPGSNNLMWLCRCECGRLTRVSFLNSVHR